MIDNRRQVAEVPITEPITRLSDIDGLLAGLYRQAASGESAGAVPTVHTVLLNLVVYCETREEADAVTETVAEILGSHPCRAITAVAMAPEPDEAEDSVSVVCGITRRGDRRLCGEIIRLHVTDGTAMGSVMPLLVADLPVYLWPQTRIPQHDPQFAELLRTAKYVIVDSRRFGDLETGLNQVIDLRRMAPEAIVHDLAWISIQSWRELTAQHFDPPSVRHHLHHISSIDVAYSAADDPSVLPACPLLLASWLLSTLELRVTTVARSADGGVEVEAQQSGRPVRVRLIPQESVANPCSLISSTITCREGEDTATFVTEAVSPTQISITQECADVCFPPRVMEITSQARPSLVAQALDLHRPDRQYVQAVDTASRITGGLGEMRRRGVREFSDYGGEQ